ncbi:hypothetical protein NDU88_002784 [Pleurodeles waltl]|uniref:Uncharacterized protein n=1 Tax=Pleurodeles waltl TaxID=8319 RepID=A0AAV7RC04_PLEWA|nr:hypothetical protein NDU88_002784 [Pleurodeles waltl]
MGRHKRTEASQVNTMEQYTTPVAPPLRPVGLEVSGDVAGAPRSVGEPSRAELLAAIQGSCVGERVFGRCQTRTKCHLTDRRDLEVPPDGHWVLEPRIGDHMVQSGWWKLATGWRYSEMEQWG